GRGCAGIADLLRTGGTVFRDFPEQSLCHLVNPIGHNYQPQLSLLLPKKVSAVPAGTLTPSPAAISAPGPRHTPASVRNPRRCAWTPCFPRGSVGRWRRPSAPCLPCGCSTCHSSPPG